MAARKADMRGADMRGADMRGADMSRASIIVSWRDVPLCSPELDEECTGADRPDLMREFRRSGSIRGWYAATRAELDALVDFEVDAPELGPRPWMVDWSGLD